LLPFPEFSRHPFKEEIPEKLRKKPKRVRVDLFPDFLVIVFWNILDNMKNPFKKENSDKFRKKPKRDF
jgi:hypothetical protein